MKRQLSKEEKAAKRWVRQLRIANRLSAYSNHLSTLRRTGEAIRERMK
jgi:hypothetical protein